jgi:hypothetical protein
MRSTRITGLLHMFGYDAREEGVCWNCFSLRGLFAVCLRRDLDLRLCLEFVEDTIARERGKRDLLFC